MFVKVYSPCSIFWACNVQSNMCTNDPFQMVTLGNWQEFTYLGDPRDLLSNARTKLSIIPHLLLDIRCPGIQSMFKVVLDNLRTNESLLSVPFNYLGTTKSCHVMWLAGLWQSQLVLLQDDERQREQFKDSFLRQYSLQWHTCTW